MTNRPDDPVFSEWIARAKSIPPHQVAAALQWTLKKATSTERVGPCPACGGEDGFSVSTSKPVWNCRRGGEGGHDAIGMVMHALGCSFVEAAETVTGEARPSSARQETPQERQEREARAAKRRADAERWERETAAAEARKRRRDEEAIDAILARSVPIWGTHAEAYLRARAINPQRRHCGGLLFCRDVDYWGWEEGQTGEAAHIATLPAMVARIREVAGVVIGLHLTILDPLEPRKWVAPWEAAVPPKQRRNVAKKIRGEQGGGLIHLGIIGEHLAIGEGIETTLSWDQIGHGIENVSLAAGVSLGNMSGKCTSTFPHPTLCNADGRPMRYPNGVPDLTASGIVLPPGVRHVTLLGDGDSDIYVTRGRLLSAGRRFIAAGVEVDLYRAMSGKDFNDELREATRALEGVAA